MMDGEVVGFGHGSGIAISPTRIVTNAHVVESAARYPGNVALGVVPSAGQNSYAGKLIAIDTARSDESRVGKAGRSRRSTFHTKTNQTTREPQSRYHLCTKTTLPQPPMRPQ